MSDIIKIDKREILQLKTEGAKLVVKKEAEDCLLKLLDLKDLVDGALDEVKGNIIKLGKEAMGANFQGVVGARVKAVYRTYGERFTTTNKNYLKEVKITRTDNDKIELYLAKNKKLPPNTIERERTNKLVITRND